MEEGTERGYSANNRRKTAFTPECVLELLVNFQVAISEMTCKERVAGRPGALGLCYPIPEVALPHLPPPGPVVYSFMNPFTTGRTCLSYLATPAGGLDFRPQDQAFFVSTGLINTFF